MKLLKVKDTKEILALMHEIQTLSHVTGKVSSSLKKRLADVENLLNEMNQLTQLQTSFEKSSRALTQNVEDLKSLVVSKNS